MKAGAGAGAMPVKVSLKVDAAVTAGLARAGRRREVVGTSDVSPRQTQRVVARPRTNDGKDDQYQAKR